MRAGLRFAGDLDRRAVVLAIHTEVDVRAESHAERVRRHFNSFDDWGAAAVEEHDLERGKDARVGEQVPRGATCTRVVAIRQVRRRNDPVLISVWVIDRDLGR